MLDPQFLAHSLPIVMGMAATGVGGRVPTTWLRITHGHALDGAWRQAVYPRNDAATVARAKRPCAENAQRRAELPTVKERLATVERIVTDGGYRLDRGIERPRLKIN